MALAPKEMGQAIIRNLKEKTGKDIDEWMEVVLGSSIEDKKERVDWLKKEHGLGHYQAVTVVNHIANKGKSDYDNTAKLVKELFSGKKQPLYEIYKCVAKEITKFGCDIKMKPCKTYIPFYRKNQFCILKPKNKTLVIGLALPKETVHPKLNSAKGLGGSDRIKYSFNISSCNELEEELINLIKMAYDAN